MGDVLEFKLKKVAPVTQVVWACGCGNLTFFLRADGAVFCENCEAQQCHTVYFWREPT